MTNDIRQPFRKDKANGMIFGVCSGLETTYGWSALWTRVGLVALTLFGFGLPILLYLAIAFLSN